MPFRYPKLEVRSARASHAMQIAGLATFYFVASKLGLRLAIVHPSATAVSPGTGIALAATRRRDRLQRFLHSQWPGLPIEVRLHSLCGLGCL